MPAGRPGRSICCHRGSTSSPSAIGQLTFENLAVGAALLPAAVIANYAGIWLVRRTPAELFFRIVFVLMFLIAIELMRGSLVELWRG